MISIMCCNVVQSCMIYEILPRIKTKTLIESAGLKFQREIFCYLKRCSRCGGARITVFAECTNGQIYFIERIKSKNVNDFLKNSSNRKRLKAFNSCNKGIGFIPLNYFDKGKELPCTVNYSDLKIAPYDPDIIDNLRVIKQGGFSSIGLGR